MQIFAINCTRSPLTRYTPGEPLSNKVIRQMSPPPGLPLLGPQTFRANRNHHVNNHRVIIICNPDSLKVALYTSTNALLALCCLEGLLSYS